MSQYLQCFESNQSRFRFNKKLGFDTVTDSSEKKDKVSCFCSISGAKRPKGFGVIILYHYSNTVL